MQDTQNDDTVVIGPKVNAAITIGKYAQTILDVVPWRSCKIGFGDPGNLGRQVCQKLAGIVRAALRDVTPYLSQVPNRERRKN